MEQYAGIDVSLEFSSVCVVDAAGKIIREARVVSEPSSLIAWFAALGMVVARIGLEAGPLSQWLYAEMKAAGLAVELLETRHVRDAFKAMPVKTDRKDARGIAQLMRLGWFRPVHCKSLPAPHDSPHFQRGPKVSAKTGSSASMAANRSINGSSRSSGMVEINS